MNKIFFDSWESLFRTIIITVLAYILLIFLLRISGKRTTVVGILFAIILYFGAGFTKAYILKYGSEIKSDEYAVTLQVVQVESNESSLQ